MFSFVSSLPRAIEQKQRLLLFPSEMQCEGSICMYCVYGCIYMYICVVLICCVHVYICIYMYFWGWNSSLHNVRCVFHLWNMSQSYSPLNCQHPIWQLLGPSSMFQWKWWHNEKNIWMNGLIWMNLPLERHRTEFANVPQEERNGAQAHGREERECTVVGPVFSKFFVWRRDDPSWVLQIL